MWCQRALLITAISLIASSPFGAGAHDLVNTNSASSAAPETDAGTALSRGRALLKQGHADQALSHLQNALESLHASKEPARHCRVARCAGRSLLDSGTVQVALEHFQKAYEAFIVAQRQGSEEPGRGQHGCQSMPARPPRAAAETAASTADNGFNANLMLAKIGDTSYRLGQLTNASAAYSAHDGEET